MPQIKASLLIAQSFFPPLFLSLIVSCLVCGRTCWWPLRFLAPCAGARAPTWLVLCCAAAVRACVITYVSSRRMSSPYVLSTYHLFSCPSDWLAVFGLRGGVLSGRLAPAQLPFFLFSLCLLHFVMFSLFFAGPSTQQYSAMAFLLCPDTPDGAFPKLFSFFF